MMGTADKHEYDEQLLTRYLVGALSGDEAERLDEQSVTDDEFAWRLDAVEHGLVDAYVNNELSGETLERFKNFYLRSAKRLEKVEFSRSLLRFEPQETQANTQAAAERIAPGSRRIDKSQDARVPLRWVGTPHWGLQLGLAGASLVILFAAAFLFVENGRLQKQIAQAYNQQIVLEQRTHKLENELDEQRSTDTKLQTELEKSNESTPAARALKTIAVLLLPPTRGLNQIASVSIPPATDRVTLRLQLESDDFPIYRAALKDPASGQTVWSGGDLKARSEGQKRIVSLSVPATVLKQQNYSVELTGVPEQGASEILSSYVFKAVFR
jgi:hypothetical protein